MISIYTCFAGEDTWTIQWAGVRVGLVAGVEVVNVYARNKVERLLFQVAEVSGCGSEYSEDGDVCPSFVFVPLIA